MPTPVPPPATATNRLIELLTATGLPLDATALDELRFLFEQRLRMKIIPQPTHWYTVPNSPAQNSGLLYIFNTNCIPYHHTLTITDTTTGLQAYKDTIFFDFGDSCLFNVPLTQAGGAPTFIAGHRYKFTLHASEMVGGMPVAVGVVNNVYKIANASLVYELVAGLLDLFAPAS